MSRAESTKRSFHNRVKEIRKSRDETQSDAAERFGLTQKTWSNYERGKREPSIDILERIGDVYDVSLDWLVRGRGSKRLDAVSAKKDDALTQRLKGWDPKSVTIVPLLGTYMGAGAGGVDDGSNAALLLHGEALRQWMRQEVGVHPDRAFLAEVRGPSMRDWAESGDLVIGERTEAVREDGIYAAEVQGELIIKHVLRRDGTLIFRSENRIYDDIVVQNDEDVHIIGRIARRIVR